MPLMQESLAAGKHVTFGPKGTSMLPMLHPGVDQVTLSPLPERLKKYDLPLYRRAGGQYVLHRVIRAGETYTCCGDHQYLPEPGLHRDQMIAVVTAFTHRGKQISVEHPLYRIYARFWCASRSTRYFIYRAINKLRRILHLNP